MSNAFHNSDNQSQSATPFDKCETVEEIDGDELIMILSRYDIGAIQRIKNYNKGSRQAPKLIVGSTKGKYLLKRRAVGRDAIDRVNFSHIVQKKLGEHRFPVAGLVETVHGNTLVEHDGRIYELFHFINGHRFDKSKPESAESGRVLAHCHDILREFSEEPAVKKTSFHQIETTKKTISEVVDVLSNYENKSNLEGMDETACYIGEQFDEAKFAAQNQLDFLRSPLRSYTVTGIREICCMKTEKL